MLAYRLISGDSLFIPRSFCPSCKKNIAWYDLVPVISWLILKARCRQCQSRISYLYPFIELLTALCFTTLIAIVPSHYYVGYGILLSALIITIRTDLETMLISRFTTLFLIPFSFFFSSKGYLPINLQQSALGALFGYIILWSINKIFYLLKKQHGIGEGDFELLSMIGSFIGIIGVWLSLLFASFSASIIGLVLILFKKVRQNTPIPFGPFIASGAIGYLFVKYYYPSFLNFFI